MSDQLHLTVPGMTCDHCVAAVRDEVAAVPGVERVEVDLTTKAVVVTGTELDSVAVAEAVEEAGYEAVF